MARIKQITSTIFKNSNGITVCLTPNYNTGGKKLHFSFKGANTLTMKAVYNGLSKMSNPAKKKFFEDCIHKYGDLEKQFKNNPQVEVRFSKGYLPASTGQARQTQQAFMVLFYDAKKDTYSAQVEMAGEDHFIEFSKEAINTNQKRAGAIGAYLWQEAAEELPDDDGDSFLGGE